MKRTRGGQYMPRGTNPNSKANLVVSKDLAPSERRKRASKAGKASVQARIARKTLREELTALLESGDTQEKISVALIAEALHGNTKAFEIIRDTIGEKPVDRVNVSTVDDATVSEMKNAIAMRAKDGTEQE